MPSFQRGPSGSRSARARLDVVTTSGRRAGCAVRVGGRCVWAHRRHFEGTLRAFRVHFRVQEPRDVPATRRCGRGGAQAGAAGARLRPWRHVRSASSRAAGRTHESRGGDADAINFRALNPPPLCGGLFPWPIREAELFCGDADFRTARSAPAVRGKPNFSAGTRISVRQGPLPL